MLMYILLLVLIISSAEGDFDVKLKFCRLKCGCGNTGKSASKQPSGYYWRDFHGIIPPDAVPIGDEHQYPQTYVGFVFDPLNNGTYVTTIVDGLDYVYNVKNGTVFKKTSVIQILCTSEPESLIWKSLTSENASSVSKNLVTAGLHLGTNKYGSQSFRTFFIAKVSKCKIGYASNAATTSEELEYAAMDGTVQKSVDKMFLLYMKSSKESTSSNGEKKKPFISHSYKYSIKGGDWAEWISRKIINNTGRKCGYYFKYHSINSDASSGHMAGSCNCGSEIDIYLNRTEENVVSFKFTVTEGNGKCGKLYLRATKRTEVAKLLKNKSVYVYRAEQADELMTEGEREPPILPKDSVLRTAKYNLAATVYMDRDPLIALQKMQLISLRDTIHSIGLSPFFVHYSSKHQHTLYRTIAQRELASVAIDSTGSIFRSLQRPDQSRSPHIFLYVIVARSSVGQIIVGQMLSERQDTGAVSFWLSDWVGRPGLPIPQEVVCDASKALLGATVRAFTNFSTISEYADALQGDDMPRCYIRMDVAHFIKKYADLLKTVRKEVKQFYLASLGKLVRSRSIEEAQIIVRALFTISMSRSDGLSNNGISSACEREKKIMDELLTGEPMDEYDFNDTPNDVDELSEDPLSTKWSQWALNQKTIVEKSIEAVEGKGVNAHLSYEFSKRLFVDLAWLPIWSCVARDKFGFGRIPATSAHVETEFAKIKTSLLADERVPMRVDRFVEKHINHISGVAKIVDAAIIEEDEMSLGQNDEFDPSHEDQGTSDINNNSPLSDQLRLSASNECTNARTVEKNNTSTLNTLTNRSLSNCPACANGDDPGGAHSCIVCKIAVHALDFCSRPYDGEEGYGQKRICIACATQTNVASILQYREVEDWRGLGKPIEKKQHRGHYLQEKYPLNAFSLKPILSKIPVLKNGDEKQLRSMKIGDEIFDFINTCAFDSLFQLFLTVSFDSKFFLEHTVRANASKSDFFLLLKRVHEAGVTSSTYRDRGKLLCAIYDKENAQDESTALRCFVVNCRTTITSLCRKLLQQAWITPSFVETTICSVCGSKKSRDYSILMIRDSSLLRTNYNEAIEDVLMVQPKACESRDCRGIESKNLAVTGSIIPNFYKQINVGSCSLTCTNEGMDKKKKKETNQKSSSAMQYYWKSSNLIEKNEGILVGVNTYTNKSEFVGQGYTVLNWYDVGQSHGKDVQISFGKGSVSADLDIGILSSINQDKFEWISTTAEKFATLDRARMVPGGQLDNGTVTFVGRELNPTVTATSVRVLGSVAYSYSVYGAYSKFDVLMIKDDKRE